MGYESYSGQASQFGHVGADVRYPAVSRPHDLPCYGLLASLLRLCGRIEVRFARGRESGFNLIHGRRLQDADARCFDSFAFPGANEVLGLGEGY
jgi:hypothetical protein